MLNGNEVEQIFSDSSLEKEMPDWRVSGKCAIISFVDNKAVQK